MTKQDKEALLLQAKETTQNELNELLLKQDKVNQNIKSFMKGFYITDAIVSTSVVTALSIFTFNGNINPFTLKDKVQEYATETVDNYNNPEIITLDNEKRENNSEASISLEFFDQWVKEEDHYKRTVTKYTIDGDLALKDYYKNNIRTITAEDINKYKAISTYTEEYFKVSGEDLNKVPYVRLTTTYKNKIVDVKETAWDNILDITSVIGLSIVLWFINIFILYFGADALKLIKKNKPTLEKLISEKQTIIADIDEQLRLIKTNNKK